MKLRIKELRMKKGIRQGDLAETLGVSRQALSLWERGDSVPSLERTLQIASALKVSLNDLISETSEFRNPTPFDTDTVLLPVYGEVSAGMGEHADDKILFYADASSKYGTGEYFYLRAKGDSMMPYIIDGDLLLVKKTPSVDNGKVAVILIDGEDGVVKKVIYDARKVTLKSYNDKYPPRVFKDAEKTRLLVLGEVVKTVRESMP